MLTALFEHVTKNPELYLERAGEEPVERLAINFIAGMTERYANNLNTKLCLPKPWM